MPVTSAAQKARRTFKSSVTEMYMLPAELYKKFVDNVCNHGEKATLNTINQTGNTSAGGPLPPLFDHTPSDISSYREEGGNQTMNWESVQLPVTPATANPAPAGTITQPPISLEVSHPPVHAPQRPVNGTQPAVNATQPAVNVTQPPINDTPNNVTPPLPVTPPVNVTPLQPATFPPRRPPPVTVANTATVNAYNRDASAEVPLPMDSFDIDLDNMDFQPPRASTPTNREDHEVTADRDRSNMCINAQRNPVPPITLFVCPTCAATFKTRVGLIKHKLSKHKYHPQERMMTAQVPLPDDDESMPAEAVAPVADPHPPAPMEQGQPPIPKLKAYRCPQCPKTYKTRPGLLRHVTRLHQKPKTIPGRRATRNTQAVQPGPPGPPAPPALPAPTGGQRRSEPEAERTMMNPKQYHALNTTDGGRPLRVAKRVVPPKRQNQTMDFPTWNI